MGLRPVLPLLHFWVRITFDKGSTDRAGRCPGVISPKTVPWPCLTLNHIVAPARASKNPNRHQRANNRGRVHAGGKRRLAVGLPFFPWYRLHPSGLIVIGGMFGHKWVYLDVEVHRTLDRSLPKTFVQEALSANPSLPSVTRGRRLKLWLDTSPPATWASLVRDRLALLGVVVRTPDATQFSKTSASFRGPVAGPPSRLSRQVGQTDAVFWSPDGREDSCRIVFIGQYFVILTIINCE